MGILRATAVLAGIVFVTPAWAFAPGLRVAAVSSVHAPGLAGVQPGDILVAWSQEDGAAGEFRTPWDLLQVERERAPRGVVTVVGTRGGTPMSWQVGNSPWSLVCDPLAPAAAEEPLRGAADPAATHDMLEEAGERLWNLPAPWPGWRAWVGLRVGGVYHLARRENTAALPWFRRALAETEGPWTPLLAAVVGDALRRSGVAEEALRIEDRGLAWLTAHGGADSQCAAFVHSQRGHALLALGRLDDAKAAFAQELALRQRDAAGSMEEAEAWNNAALVPYQRGEFAVARAAFEAGLAIRERLRPGSPEAAFLRINLAAVCTSLGEHEDADTYLHEAAAALGKIPAMRRYLAFCLHNLGVSRFSRGDLVGAEDYYRQALAIRRELAPETPEMTATLNNLATILHHRGDLAGASDLYRQSLAMMEKLMPGSTDIPRLRSNLGLLEQQRGDFEAAEQWFRRALAGQEQLGVSSMARGGVMTNLGMLEFDRRRFPEARAWFDQVLEVRRREVPGTLDMALSALNVALVEFELGDMDEAWSLVEEAIAIYRRFDAEHASLAEALLLRARILEVRGDAGQAASVSLEAVGELAHFYGNLGGDMLDRARATGARLANYAFAVRLQVEAGRPGEAFALIEHARSSAFAAWVAERNPDLGAALPQDLAARRADLDRRYDEVLTSAMETAPGPQQEQALAALRALREERRSLERDVRQQAPHAARFAPADPLGAAEAAALLAPGEVALSWFCGSHVTWLVALRSDGRAAAFRIPEGRSQLSVRVRRLREAIDAGGEWREAAQQLGALLVAPARSMLRGARGLVLLPDGPLHLAPLALLPMDRSGRAIGERFVVREAFSMESLRGSRREQGGASPAAVAGFGGVPYGVPDGPEGNVRLGDRVRASLAPLPATRSEVQRLKGLFPTAVAYLGADATEAQVTGLKGRHAIVHLAVHGLLDEARPLDSALVMAGDPEGNDNGLLQAWEILERMSLDADLVVLSACDSALGGEFGGAGIVGLGRAFQAAGARNLLMSLWPVSDEGTAALMDAFYGHLAAGVHPAEALQRAQAEMRRGRFAEPRYWAGFKLVVASRDSPGS